MAAKKKAKAVVRKKRTAGPKKKLEPKTKKRGKQATAATVKKRIDAAKKKRKKGGAPKGNQFWLKRAKSGRDKIFMTPENLWDAAVEYFEWVRVTPLKEQKVFHSQGHITRTHVNHIRAMTIGGICLFLGVGRMTWNDYKARDEFSYIIEEIEEVIRMQKFEGAAADLLNANIIARDLGLKDSSEISGPDNGPIHAQVTFVGVNPKVKGER